MPRSLTTIVLSLLAVSALASPVGAQELASGEFALEASTGPGDPVFNSPLTAKHVMPMGIGSTSGVQISVGLRDVSRPEKVCDRTDPSGGLFDDCAAVDWPFPGRRGINLLEVETVSGLQTLHLRMTDTLAPDPEPKGP
ncbi:MAG: hypothetical protein AAF657_08505 [Acidobacteriota bacterium]